MLPRLRRLTRSSDIKHVVERGHATTTPHLRIHWRPSAIGEPRVACVVGKKVSAKSTVRHRIQRQLRHSIAAFFKTHATVSSHDIVVVAKPSSLQGKAFTDVYQELHSALSSILT